MRKQNAFTLMEILIIVTLITVIAATVIVLLDPLKQIQRSYDARRKADLDTLKKVIEDYYNDTGCYPKPRELCYIPPSIQNVCNKNITVSKIISQLCFICGLESSSPKLLPYIQQLPCDPLHPKDKYVYEVQADESKYDQGIRCTSNPDPDTVTNSCPQWYRVYSSLEDPLYDADSRALGCVGSGCGFSSAQISPFVTGFPAGYGFEYGISGNAKLESYDSWWWCVTGTYPNKSCGGCGHSYFECLQREYCDKNKIYPGRDTCRLHL